MTLKRVLEFAALGFAVLAIIAILADWSGELVSTFIPDALACFFGSLIAK